MISELKMRKKKRIGYRIISLGKDKGRQWIFKAFNINL